MRFQFFSKLKHKPAFRYIFFFAEFVLLLLLFYITLFRVLPVPLTPLMTYRSYPIKKDWVPLKKISPHLVRCAITSEDPHFLTHWGFDFKAMKNALEKNEEYEEKGKNKMLGGSTISQQTAKNLFLWTDRSYLRKGLEFPLTGMIELFWTKKRIIEVYLNVIEMGKGIYGCEAAAETYYKKSAADLSLTQAASIVVIFPGPLVRDPLALNSKLAKKTGRIARWSAGIELPEDWYPVKENPNTRKKRR